MNMTLEYWEKHAQTACFETKLQVKEISEGVFYALTQQPQIQIIQKIINNGSDTLVFVLFSYLGKYPQPFANIFQKVTYLITCVNAWQFKNFTFYRNNHPPFQKYVTRTIMTTLGIFLKISYENASTSHLILDFLINLQSKYVKLYLLKSFVDAVEAVDYEMGYMRYRMMVYSFQDNAIPMICQILMPYFYSIEEGVQINQLSFMQQKLNVNDDAMTSSQQQLTLTSQQELETDFVFLLLQKIVEFNYNITYSEYQSDTPIQTCLISFPDKVSQKILNRQFLNALFFIIDKVSDAKVGGKKHEYLQISLNCVAKMMQSRLNYLKQQVKQQFIYHSIKGLTLLLMKCHQIGSQTLLKGIIVCNKRLYMNCQLSYLKKNSIKLSENNSAQLYNVYIKNLLDTIIIVCNNSTIHVDNHLLSEALELSNKIILSYGFRDEENMDQEYMFFMKFVESVINSFINNLCQPHSIFQSFNIISVSECKTWVNELFEKFKKIASTNFFYFFEQLSQKINLITSLSIQSSIYFANILFLSSQIIDYNYLQRNLLLNSAKDRQYTLLSSIVNKALIIIRQYVCNRVNYKCPQSSYIDSSVIIFIEAISIDFISRFQFSGKFKIKQKLFQFMMYGKALCFLNDTQDNKSQETILTFIYILTSYIQTQNQKDDDLMLTQYSLDVLQKIIIKIKGRLTSQIYQKMVIIQYLQDFFEKMFYSSLIHCDIRTRSSKIIAILTLQTLQQYKNRINKYIAIMKMQSIKIVQYDLIGIFQGIQSYVIIKYLYRRLNKEIKIQSIVQTLFAKAKHEHNQRQYQDLCKILSCLLYNRYFRSQFSIIIYQNYTTLLPHLIQILKQINQDEDIDMDLWQSSLIILLELFKGFLTGGLNVFLLETCSSKNSSVNLVQQYVFQFMKIIINVTTSIKQYPQLEPIILNIIHQINKCLLDYVFKDATRRLPYIHAYLHAKTIDLCIENMRMLLHGNKVQQQKLVLALDGLQYFYTYFNSKRKMTHQAVTYSNLQYHYELLQKFSGQASTLSKNEHFICSLLNFIVSNHKNNITYLRKIARLLFQLNQTFPQYVVNSIAKLQVNNQKLVEIQAILSFPLQEDFIEKLKAWVREIDVFG